MLTAGFLNRPLMLVDKSASKEYITSHLPHSLEILSKRFPGDQCLKALACLIRTDKGRQHNLVPSLRALYRQPLSCAFARLTNRGTAKKVINLPVAL